MNHTRSIGVAEARVGLTILTCLLVVLGYVVLQRVGGTGQTPLIENRSPSVVGGVPFENPKPRQPEQPDVVKVEGTELQAPTDLKAPTVPHTTLRPQQHSPQQ